MAPTSAAFFSDSEEEDDDAAPAVAVGLPGRASAPSYAVSVKEKARSKVRETALAPSARALLPATEQPPPAFPFVQLDAKKREPDSFLQWVEKQKPGQDITELHKKVKDLFHGPQSFSGRSITLQSEDGTQTMTVAATVSTTVQEIKELIAAITKLDARDLRVMVKKGPYWREEDPFGEVSSKVRVVGCKHFAPVAHRFQHSLVVVGAGFGGISQAIELVRNGHEDFVVFERLPDFGGRSWIKVANKHTKLQTEKGTYHINYPYPEAACPSYMPVWPSRDQLLAMFREEAVSFGLEQKTVFNAEVTSVECRGQPEQLSRHFAVAHAPTDGRASSGEVFLAGAISAWPGNLCFPVEIKFPGEHHFGGYIEYGSCNMTDYTRAAEKPVLLYGHGAFTIENVRTLIEHQAEKIWIVCRKRNLTAPKMLSWLVSQTSVPATGAQALRVWEVMYKLVGFDPWTCHCVHSDAMRSMAHLKQQTVFGVTDVYFLALYYGKAVCVVDEIKRLSHHTAHLKKGGELSCEVILKVVGITGDPSIDKNLGIEHLTGLWVNGDAFRPCVSNGFGVNAQNFGSFSVGPSIVGNMTVVHHFLFNPLDLNLVRDYLPRRVADRQPCYCFPGDFLMTTMTMTMMHCPAVAVKCSHFDGMKAWKQHRAHPLKEFLEECRREWQMYTEMIDMPQVDPPPYPYTEEMMLAFMQEILDNASKAQGKQSQLQVSE